MNKKILVPTILAVLVIVIVAIVLAVQEPQSQVDVTQVDGNSASGLNETDLSSDVDTSDWVTYESDVYGYRFKLPHDFIFVSEYDAAPLWFNPNEDNQGIVQVKDTKYIDVDREWDGQMTFTVTEFNEQDSIKDINEYISDFERESKAQMCFLYKNKDGLMYYAKANDCEGHLLPTLIYNGEVLLEFTFNYIKPIYIQKIIDSVQFN